MQLTLGQIARMVGGSVTGSGETVISDVAEIQHALPNQITFLANPRYAKYVATTKAAAIIVDEQFTGNYPHLIRVANPNYAFSQMLAYFRPELPNPPAAIHPTAVVDPTVRLGQNVYLGPQVVVAAEAVIADEAVIHAGCYIGVGSTIGRGTVLFPRVTIYHRCHLGQKVRVHSGVVIGSDGFGFTRVGNGIEKIPQAGGVVIQDEVEIGANTTIDRGTVGDTVIGRGTKLDNLIQVAHNVKIGQYCFFAALTGIAGSAIIEDYVAVGGQVGIAGHIRVGTKAMIAAQSGVSKDVPPGAFMFGAPAVDRTRFIRDQASIHAIPELKERLKKVEELLKANQGEDPICREINVP